MRQQAPWISDPIEQLDQMASSISTVGFAVHGGQFPARLGEGGPVVVAYGWTACELVNNGTVSTTAGQGHARADPGRGLAPAQGGGIDLS